MFLDARKMPSGTVIDTDVCIIGAGAAGITLARQLIGHPVRVCLLESGGLRIDRETQRLYEGETVGIPYELETTRSRFFGGSTNWWGGFSRPQEDLHFERRDWVPDSGWPISRADLEPYYARAHEVCGIEADAYDPERVLPELEGNDLRPLPLSGGRVITSLTRLSKEKRRFGKAYREELARAANITVYTYANVIDLALDAYGSSIERVRVATLAGNQLSVTARMVVLATGAIENARLLLASNAVESCGVGNRSDQVGRYFMEHPRTVVAEVALSSVGERALRAYLPRYAMLRLPVAAELNVSPEVQRAEGLLDAAAYVELVMQGEEAAGTVALKQLYWDMVWRGARPRAPLQQLAAIAAHPKSLATFGLGLFTCAERFVRCRRITVIAEQAPNPDSRVMLSHQRDRLGMQRVRLDWRMTELDRYALRRTAEILGEELSRAGLLSVSRFMPEYERDVLTPQWNWHHMGTTRMHEDPSRGVVDPQCRVHGVANLFIAGSSVFPTAGNHTPTFTIVALAIRLAEHLRRQLSRRPIRLVHERARTPAKAQPLSPARAARGGFTGPAAGVPRLT